MPKFKHRVPNEIRHQILERVKGGIPITQASEEHGVSEKTIYNWLSKGATAPPSWLEVAKLKKENQSLKELIGHLTYEKTVAQKKN